MKKNHKVANTHGSAITDAMSKSEAYRRCREMCGKKAGGTKPYKVQRVSF